MKKTVSQNGQSVSTHYLYDEAGQLLGEYTASGAAVMEVVYLDGQPVLALQGNGAIHSVQADHLNTPRALVNENGNTVWRWDSDAYGTTPAHEDPDGNGVAVTFNWRFPGQSYDADTGLHYNYFRDYDPVTGRYIESDPIGLEGGVNTYGYVGGGPLNRIDPTGEAGQVVLGCISGSWAGPLGCAAGVAVVTVGTYYAVKEVGNAVARSNSSSCPEDDECGPDTRAVAFLKAMVWASISPDAPGPAIPWEMGRSRGRPISGRNYTYVRQNGGNVYGYEHPSNGKAKVRNHPDGHPHQIGSEHPDHHRCPHFHAVSTSGEEKIFIYRRGT